MPWSKHNEVQGLAALDTTRKMDELQITVPQKFDYSYSSQARGFGSQVMTSANSSHLTRCGKHVRIEDAESASTED